MKLTNTLAILLIAAGAASPALAAGDLTRADIQKVTMEMGTDDDGNMYFSPSEFTFETGKAYNWVLTNVDDYKHELSIHELRERIFTRKLEISTPDGDLVAEIKGDITEVEVGPGQTVEWFFVPVQTTKGPVEITCEIAGHYDAGMHGLVTLN